MIKDNHHITYIPHIPNWTPVQKQANCNACLLAENMKDCKHCPFYTPKNDTVSIMKEV